MPSMVKHTASAMHEALDEAGHTDATEDGMDAFEGLGRSCRDVANG